MTFKQKLQSLTKEQLIDVVVECTTLTFIQTDIENAIEMLKLKEKQNRRQQIIENENNTHEKYQEAKKKFYDFINSVADKHHIPRDEQGRFKIGDFMKSANAEEREKALKLESMMQTTFEEWQKRSHELDKELGL